MEGMKGGRDVKGVGVTTDNICVDANLSKPRIRTNRCRLILTGLQVPVTTSEHPRGREPGRRIETFLSVDSTRYLVCRYTKYLVCRYTKYLVRRYIKYLVCPYTKYLVCPYTKYLVCRFSAAVRAVAKFCVYFLF